MICNIALKILFAAIFTLGLMLGFFIFPIINPSTKLETETSFTRFTNITVSPCRGFVEFNKKKFHYVALDVSSLGVYSYNEFVLIFQNIHFHYIPLLTTGCRIYRFEITFPDNSIENLTLSVCPRSLGPSREYAFSEHKNPQVGLYLDPSNGILYLLVSWEKPELKPTVSVENENWIFEMKLNATKLYQGDSLKIDFYLRPKKNFILKCLTRPSFSIEIYDLNGLRKWRFYPPVVCSLNYNITTNDKIEFSWTIKIVKSRDESNSVDMAYLPSGTYVIVSEPLIDPPTGLKLSIGIQIREYVGYCNE